LIIVLVEPLASVLGLSQGFKTFSSKTTDSFYFPKSRVSEVLPYATALGFTELLTEVSALGSTLLHLNGLSLRYRSVIVRACLGSFFPFDFLPLLSVVLIEAEEGEGS
jgi:hypothetical protein